MKIGYKYNYREVLEFIATEGSGSTEPVNPYLSIFPDIFSNVSVHPIVRPHFLGRHFNDFHATDNQNRMCQYDLELQKYWMTQSGYFRLATTATLGMVITDGKLLFCYRISEGSMENKMSTRYYNHRTVYN